MEQEQEHNKYIVKYNNAMNEIPFSGFYPAELNLLMVLCSKLKEKGTDEIMLTFSEIRSLSKFWSRGNKPLILSLINMNHKLQQISCDIAMDGHIYQLVLFYAFDIDTNNSTLTISVNPKYSFLLNNLSRNFTRFELSEFVSLEGKYDKLLYMILKQFRTTGIVKIDSQTFRERMDIPASYQNRDVMQKIIKPSVSALNAVFSNLTVEIIKSNTWGHHVTGYIFKFDAEPIRDEEQQEQTEPKSLEEKTDVADKQDTSPSLPYKMVPPRAGKRGSFFDFEQRDYDYDDLTKQIFKAQDKKEELENQKAEQADKEAGIPVRNE